MAKFYDFLVEADRSGTAMCHFNISDLVAFKAVAETVRTLAAPVALGASESARLFMGIREAAALAKMILDAYSQPIFLNADHTHSLNGAEEAPRSDFDSVVYDRSELHLEQNISETSQ